MQNAALVVAQISIPRRGGGEDSDELRSLGDGVFLLVSVVVLMVLAGVVTIAIINWRAGRNIRKARKLAQAAENRARRSLIGEDDVRSTRLRK